MVDVLSVVESLAKELGPVVFDVLKRDHPKLDVSPVQNNPDVAIEYARRQALARTADP